MSPNLSCVIISTGEQEIPMDRLKLDPGHQVLMGRDGIDTAPLPKVPYFAGVVTTPSCNVVAIGGEIYSIDLLQVAFQEHDTASCAQIPHSAKCV